MRQDNKIISTQIKTTTDISKLVKKFITHQTDTENTPFDILSSPVKRKSENYQHKVALTDWRVLFNVGQLVKGNGNGNGGKRGGMGGRKIWTSQRKFDITQFPDAGTTRTENRTRMNKTSTSFRGSYLESAIVQNLYE